MLLSMRCLSWMLFKKLQLHLLLKLLKLFFSHERISSKYWEHERKISQPRVKALYEAML